MLFFFVSGQEKENESGILLAKDLHIQVSRLSFFGANRPFHGDPPLCWRNAVARQILCSSAFHRTTPSGKSEVQMVVSIDLCARRV